MAQAILCWMARAQVVIALLALVIALSPVRADRYGDRLQIALPLLAWACEGSRGAGSEFLARYAVMFTAAHGSKQALGDAPANRRPNGGGQGFPSAHTSTAVLGASALVHGCLQAAPLAQAAVIGAAAFVGASRIEAGAHDIWQVLAGALLGFAADRALRRPSAARRAVGGGAAAAFRITAMAAQGAVRVARRLYALAAAPRQGAPAASPPPPGL
jgi:membrane-associated phospholipid phosphatase